MSSKPKEDPMAEFRQIDYRKINGAIEKPEDKPSYIEHIESEVLVYCKVQDVLIYDKEIVIRTVNKVTFIVKYVKGHFVLEEHKNV